MRKASEAFLGVQITKTLEVLLIFMDLIATLVDFPAQTSTLVSISFEITFNGSQITRIHSQATFQSLKQDGLVPGEVAPSMMTAWLSMTLLSLMCTTKTILLNEPRS